MYPVKNKERHSFYKSIKDPVISYAKFSARCNNKHYLTPEIMRELVSTPAKKRTSYIDTMGRECCECGIYKEWEKFPTSPRYADGHYGMCKACRKEKYYKYKSHVKKMSNI